MSDDIHAVIKRLERSVWDSRVMPSTSDVRALLETLEQDREVLAEGYKAISGKRFHDSDCATSSAPAERPGPCDCDCRIDHDVAEQVLDLFNGGIVRVADDRNPRGYVDYYRPVEAMSAALARACRPIKVGEDAK